MGNPAENAATTDAQTQSEGAKQEPVDWEKRYKDTQSAFTKKSQELVAAKATIASLEAIQATPLQLDKSVIAELEDLKITNPEEWRNKLNQIENEHKEKINASVQAKIQEMGVSEQRVNELYEFQASHPGFILNDDDVPPRIAKRLTSGAIDFKTFLQEVHDFVTAPKAFGDSNKTTGQPNLSAVAGNTTPSQQAVYEDIRESYKKDVY